MGTVCGRVREAYAALARVSALPGLRNPPKIAGIKGPRVESLTVPELTERREIADFGVVSRFFRNFLDFLTANAAKVLRIDREWYLGVCGALSRTFPLSELQKPRKFTEIMRLTDKSPYRALAERLRVL